MHLGRDEVPLRLAQVLRRIVHADLPQKRRRDLGDAQVVRVPQRQIGQIGDLLVKQSS